MVLVAAILKNKMLNTRSLRELFPQAGNNFIIDAKIV